MSKTIRFNAGKVQYDDETKKCTPLPHKGVVTVAPSTEDEGFFDFTWTPKSDSGVEKDELLLIPGDMTFRRVHSCHTGRVVALTFLSSGDKSLYWLQDVGDDEELDKWTDKDVALVQSVQQLVSPTEDDEEASEQPAVKEEPAVAARHGPTSSAPSASAAAHCPVSSLADVLTDELLERHLSALSPEEIKARYGDLLPENVEPTSAEVLAVVRSEFFRAANAELSSNVAENNLGSFLASSFGYEYEGEGLEAFLRGLRAAAKKEHHENDA
ncbi:hypothetical protein OXX69_001938 [Metschnikowia pulcherrima]